MGLSIIITVHIHYSKKQVRKAHANSPDSLDSCGGKVPFLWYDILLPFLEYGQNGKNH